MQDDILAPAGESLFQLQAADAATTRTPGVINRLHGGLPSS